MLVLNGLTTVDTDDNLLLLIITIIFIFKPIVSILYVFIIKLENTGTHLYINEDN